LLLPKHPSQLEGKIVLSRNSSHLPENYPSLTNIDKERGKQEANSWSAGDKNCQVFTGDRVSLGVPKDYKPKFQI
jgi:hypothetical protein